MTWARWLAVVFGIVLGGWLTFDGAHAFATGDYVTPKSGEHAGELGPWARVVDAVGLEPRSALLKTVHVVLGLAWLAVSIALMARATWAWVGLLACAGASLWYMPFGTVIGIASLLLVLLAPGLREAA